MPARTRRFSGLFRSDLKNPNHIPVHIIAGLFGSGKTTLVERWAAEVAGRRFIKVEARVRRLNRAVEPLRCRRADLRFPAG